VTVVRLFCEGPDDVHALARIAQDLFGAKRKAPAAAGSLASRPRDAVAIALGAISIERHITLDRARWGSDQAASVEPLGFEKLVKYIRVTEASLGDGVKKIYESELGSMK
jgi:hypothetical protein